MAKRIIIILTGLFGFWVVTQLVENSYLLGVADTLTKLDTPPEPGDGEAMEPSITDPYVGFNHEFSFNRTVD